MDRTCAVCADPLTSANPRAVYCSARCRSAKAKARRLESVKSKTAVRTCAVCPNPLTSKNPRARYCSSTCRSRKSEGRLLTLAAPAAADDDRGPVCAATRDELVAAGRDRTALGQAALALASRIDLGIDTGSSLASAVKALGDTIAIATRGARREETALDRVRQSRDAKRGA